MRSRPLASVLTITASLFAFSARLSAEPASQIAVVDTQRAVMETEDGIRMQATLRKVFDARQLELDKKQNDLQKERENLEKQRGVLAPDVLQQRAEKWQTEVATVQQMFVDYNRELQKKQNELMQPILAQALQVVQKLATAEGYVMVIDKQAVPYVRPDLDLTERLINAYNAGPSVSAAPAPAAPAGKGPAAVSKGGAH
ncbi:MAG TPA: OmpH family outer membrane protein [Polyangiaceae bacterium]|jgi:outer membrane protein|nr:OmpH family outer membrane protein [Polyangiaceae bacterium]